MLLISERASDAWIIKFHRPTTSVMLTSSHYSWEIDASAYHLRAWVQHNENKFFYDPFTKASVLPSIN